MLLPACQVARLGTVEYRQAWELQLKLAETVRHGDRPNTLLLMEHPPVYTRGRLSGDYQILLKPQELSQLGVRVYEVDRGGQTTFHGPGQLVGYPIVDLKEWGGPIKYVRTLEQIIIQSLADLGIKADLIRDLTGVWVDNAKIAAIGVKISRGISYHGFAININTDLSYFDYIVPCGISDRPVTSLAKILGQEVDMGMVQYSLVYHFGKVMGFRMVEIEGEGAYPNLPVM